MGKTEPLRPFQTHSKSARSPHADHDTERLSGRGCRGTPWHACVHTHTHTPCSIKSKTDVATPEPEKGD